jgi:hypothetical protein
MRKAAAGLGRKATSRRRQAQEQQLATKQEDPVTSPSNEQKQSKQINDEQALTAKNYRLAKELVRIRKCFFCIRRKLFSPSKSSRHAKRGGMSPKFELPR